MYKEVLRGVLYSEAHRNGFKKKKLDAEAIEATSRYILVQALRS